MDSVEQEEGDLRPTRTLTDKGHGAYQSTVDKYKSRLDDSWKNIGLLINTISDEAKFSTLCKIEDDLNLSYEKLSVIREDFTNFLRRTKTEESEKYLQEVIVILDERTVVVEETFRNISELKEVAIETVSVVSRAASRKSRSSGSQVDTVVTLKRAKAQAAKVRVKYAEEENLVLRRKAQLEEQQTLSAAKEKAYIERSKLECEAELKLLQEKKAAAEVDAELRALELEAEERGSVIYDLPRESENSLERTAKYVEARRLNFTPEFEDGNLASHQHPIDSHLYVEPHTNSVHDGESRSAPTEVNNQLSEFTRFLLKKDLLMSRLRNFDDKAESFAAWKTTFQNITKELCVSTEEEIDLLIKFLGPDSSKHATSIKTANYSDSRRCLHRIWERLNDRYGSPEMVESALKQKLANIPKLTDKDNKRLYDICDILSEVEALKEDQRYATLLAYFDSSAGILPVVNKLPHSIQEKWTSHAVNYKRRNNVTFPPFPVFVEFMRDISRVKNDPSFQYGGTQSSTEKPFLSKTKNFHVTTKKTVSQQEVHEEPDKECPLHHTKHTLNECRAFRNKSLEERRKFLKENGICFRCCESTNHYKRDCKRQIECTECKSNTHPSALHVTLQPTGTLGVPRAHGGEQQKSAEIVDSKCTQICKDTSSISKSCSKTVLVNVYCEGSPDNVVKLYAIIDDQSNRSLAKSKLLDILQVNSRSVDYVLTSCAGSVPTKGRRATGLIVQSLDGRTNLKLPTLIECNNIPNVRSEIPTPDVARSYPHLKDIAKFIPDLDDSSDTLLLIGRDLTEAHHVLDQRLGPRTTPYAQRLRLGWVIVGESCLNGTHRPEAVNVNKVHILGNGRPSLLEPCANVLDLKETGLDTFVRSASLNATKHSNYNDSDIFMKTAKDEKIAFSIEDSDFLDLMDREFRKDCDGSWTAPLPFRKNRPKLPNNRFQAMKRAKILTDSLRKNTVKGQHFTEFMEKIFSEGHAEPAPTIDSDKECWYLPLFGVYHPQKPDQIRGVFDSSARFNNVSLNDVLMSGPDLTNRLIGILLRFRQEPVALMADIQRMFYCFKVEEEHRNYLRFLWHRDNNIENEIIDFRMCVHVFGNSPSPAVATYGLRRTAMLTEKHYGTDMREFVNKNFYVDDALISLPTSKEVISLVKRTQEALKTGGNLRLHKICSNSNEVLSAFNKEDLAKELRDLDFDRDNLPLQRSLGVCWNLQLDTFTFRVSLDEKPFTRRGVLSVVNGLYDPLGFAMPVTIGGKLLLREAMIEPIEWDQPLSDDLRAKFDSWRDSLISLENVNISRAYIHNVSERKHSKDLLVFSDASEKAIATVAYLRTFDENDMQHLTFVTGKAKVAPKHGHTIPRLELCAAVMGVEIYETIQDELDLDLNQVTFFSDSKVVLGYINNETKRFHVYVRNRIDKIRRISKPEQWRYVPTNLNPADEATRSIPAGNLQESMWLNGPPRKLFSQEDSDTSFPLVSPEDDKEVRALKTNTKTTLGCHYFEKFSNWRDLERAIRILKNSARFNGVVHDDNSVSEEESQIFIIKTLQNEAFQREIEALHSRLPLPRQSTILPLSPYLDDLGVLRVGGRLRNAKMNLLQTNPIIIPKHHVSDLIVRYYHEMVHHQGRQITEGAIRNAGFWLIGSRRLVTSHIHHCVKCRKLRGRQEEQKMADLPAERFDIAPPFTYIGVDVFGPWTISTRKTRGGQANSKRWALMITCLVVRAVHIEILEEMTSSCFINALRRFCAIRGEVKVIRSDCGTNFVGSVQDLNANVVSIETRPVKDYLVENRINWVFNPPHSSHMGGVWERMIGVARRILDSLLHDVKHLTHEVLTTLMAEVSSIMNARPLVPVSSDPENPLPLTPNTLLTMKTDQSVQCFQMDDFNPKDLYKKQWKCVQYLADQFWTRWKREYLPTLQCRRKWQQDRANVKEDDIVLIRDKSLHRNEWPMGIIVKTYPSDDNKVRKVDVRTGLDRKVFTRSVGDVVLLLSE